MSVWVLLKVFVVYVGVLVLLFMFLFLVVVVVMAAVVVVPWVSSMKAPVEDARRGHDRN